MDSSTVVLQSFKIKTNAKKIYTIYKSKLSSPKYKQKYEKLLSISEHRYYLALKLPP